MKATFMSKLTKASTLSDNLNQMMTLKIHINFYTKCLHRHNTSLSPIISMKFPFHLFHIYKCVQRKNNKEARLKCQKVVTSKEF